MHTSDILVSSKTLAHSSDKVLRNTYLLLALTLLFATVIAGASAALALPAPGLIITLVGFYGLMFLTERNRNSGLGLLFAFAFTGFVGYTLGPILNRVIAGQGIETVMLALGGTALTFLALSAYVLISRKDMSFLGGMLTAGFVVILVAMIANLFLQLPALNLVLSSLFILFSSGAILWQTSAIIHGGETNYISATVSLFVSIFNIFVSLLNLLGGNRN